MGGDQQIGTIANASADGEMARLASANLCHGAWGSPVSCDTQSAKQSSDELPAASLKYLSEHFDEIHDPLHGPGITQSELETYRDWLPVKSSERDLLQFAIDNFENLRNFDTEEDLQWNGDQINGDDIANVLVIPPLEAFGTDSRS